MDFPSIIELEKKLLDCTVRKSSKDLNQLLADDFLEFGTSGRIYNKKIIIERLAEEVPSSVEADDFSVVELGPNAVQLRFKTRRKNDDGSFSASLRSSIWRNIDGQWQMIFHQGTRTT